MAERMIEVVGWKDPIGGGLYNMGVTDERIVRCRDCKHWTLMTIDFGEMFTPIKGHVCIRDNAYLGMSAIDFCSKGEPKEERWQDKTYEFEAENERLRQELATREESEQEKCIEYLRQENIDWEDKYRSVVRENAKLHDALKTIIAGVHHEICEGRVSHECKECAMSHSNGGCAMTDAMRFLSDDEMYGGGDEYESVELGDGTGFVRLTDYEKAVAENAKLRELIRTVWLAGDFRAFLGVEEIKERMRELEIEVDE